VNESLARGNDPPRAHAYSGTSFATAVILDATDATLYKTEASP